MLEVARCSGLHGRGGSKVDGDSMSTIGGAAHRSMRLVSSGLEDDLGPRSSTAEADPRPLCLVMRFCLRRCSFFPH